jgi:hypothetical protein
MRHRFCQRSRQQQSVDAFRGQFVPVTFDNDDPGIVHQDVQPVKCRTDKITDLAEGGAVAATHRFSRTHAGNSSTPERHRAARRD